MKPKTVWRMSDTMTIPVPLGCSGLLAESIILTLTGEMQDCRTASGIFDMQGNLWEWVDSGTRTSEGLPVVDKRGGGHYGAAPVKCSRHADGQHPPEWDGTIGFRCCLAP